MKKENNLRHVLSRLAKLSINDLNHALLMGQFKEEMYYKGYLACICTLSDYYKIKKLDIDKESLLYYIKGVK